MPKIVHAKLLITIVEIALIIICYGFAFYSITKHSDSSATKIKIQANKYKGNHLPNGASPLDACFGSGDFNGNATLTVDNGASADAIVCLYSISDGHTYRNVYVCKNNTVTIEGISQGYYKIRVLYGNDWNPQRDNPCGHKGYFDSDVYFSEFDGTEYFEDSYDGYTIAKVTLYTVSGGNASTSRINQSEFFNN